MSEVLFGAADCGASQTRIIVCDDQMREVGRVELKTDPDNYDGTVNAIADNTIEIAKGYGGELVAASVVVAATVDDGELVVSGALSPWLGKRLGNDVAEAVDLPFERVCSLNDMDAAAISQQRINEDNERPMDGIAMTLSSGWGGSRYGFDDDGRVTNIEPGHRRLRTGAKCPCGQDGHAEAFISGNGVRINHGVSMQERLKNPQAADQLVTDISTAVIGLIEEQRADGFEPDELRWTGGVALNQPLIMRRAAQTVRDVIGEGPAWENLTMLKDAGLHGAYLEARRLAKVA